MSTIVLAEDDPLQRELLESELAAEFPHLQIVPVTTESEFMSRLPELVALQPDLLVIDVMLLWAYPGANAPKPPADYGGFARAGVRCLRHWIASGSKAKVLMHTVIPESDINPDLEEIKGNYAYVAKDDEGEALIEAVRQGLRAKN